MARQSIASAPEQQPDPRDADELHDELLSAGFLTPGEIAGVDPSFVSSLFHSHRACMADLKVRPTGDVGTTGDVDTETACMADLKVRPTGDVGITGDVDTGDACRADLQVRRILIAAERLPELRTIHPDVTIEPAIVVPARRADRTWTREDCPHRSCCADG
jgi:hypothetical protein